MALVMVMGCIPMTAYANDGTQTTTSIDDNKENYELEQERLPDTTPNHLLDDVIKIAIIGPSDNMESSDTITNQMVQVITNTLAECNYDTSAVEIVPVKAYEPDAEITPEAIACGIDTALQAQADYICLNDTLHTDTSMIQEAITRAYEAGVLSVVSAGSENVDVSTVTPSCIEPAIVVAEAKNVEEMSDRANFGATIDYAAYGMSEVLAEDGVTKVEISGNHVATARVLAYLVAADDRSLTVDERLAKIQAMSFMNEKIGYPVFGELPEKDVSTVVPEENIVLTEDNQEEVPEEQTKSPVDEISEDKVEEEQTTEESIKEEDDNPKSSSKSKKADTELEVIKMDDVGATSTELPDNSIFFNPDDVYYTTTEIDKKYFKAKNSDGEYNYTFNNVGYSRIGWILMDYRCSKTFEKVDGKNYYYVNTSSNKEIYPLMDFCNSNARSNTDNYEDGLNNLYQNNNPHYTKAGIKEKKESTRTSTANINNFYRYGYKKGQLVVKNLFKGQYDYKGTYKDGKNCKVWWRQFSLDDLRNCFYCEVIPNVYCAYTYGYYLQYNYGVKDNDGNKIKKKILIEDDINAHDLEDNPYTKTGYTFAGWTTISSNTNTLNSDFNSNSSVYKNAGEEFYSISPNKSESATDTTRNLYAVWTPRTATIKYNANGGSGSISNTTMTYDKEFTIRNGSGFTRKGYHIVSWNTKADGTGTTYGLNGGEKKNLTFNKAINWNKSNQSVTLYAIWAPNTNTVIYDANGGTDSGSDSTDFTYNVSNTLSEGAGFSRRGYTLDSWNTKADGTGKKYTLKQEMTNPSIYLNYDKSTKKGSNPQIDWNKTGQTVTLYAQWKEKTYTIQYKPNGGAGIMANGTKYYTKTYTISDNAFVRPGYTFVGWNTAADGSGKDSYKPGDPYKKNESLILYAQWQEDFKVAYIGNGQSEGDNVIDAGTNNKGYSENNTYSLSDNASMTNFDLKQELDVYVDSDGNSVKEKIQSTVVGWRDKSKKNYYPLESNIKGDTFVLENHITIDKPDDDFYRPWEELRDNSSFSGMTTFAQTVATKGASTKKIGAGYGGVPYVNVYAVWDRGPVIEAYDRYYTLSEAQNGVITEDLLLSDTTATDKVKNGLNDTSITLQKGVDATNNTLYDILDYQASDFTSLTGEADISVTYRARDSVGNVTTKMVMVHIIDTHYDRFYEPEAKVRFISEKYLNTLNENSVWVKNPEYKAALADALSYKRENPTVAEEVPFFEDVPRVVEGTGTWNKKPQSVWSFTHEQVKEIQDYVWDLGPIEYVSEEALSTFLSTYASCRTT